MAPLNRYTTFTTQFWYIKQEKLLLVIFNRNKILLHFCKYEKFDTIAFSFYFFIQNFILFTFSELPSVGFY
jgi:hypothetical protein